MAGQVLSDRYEIQQQLAKKAGRRTFLARDLETQALVVVKLLSFSSDFEWDDLKLFQREAETLKAITHPCIPRYLDYFELNSQNFKGFALVQSYIAAKSLEEYLKAGRNFSEAEVKQIAASVLEILIYLHKRQPPIIHRDIKPSNILVGEHSNNSVGLVYLVDFGSVQNLAAREGGTMTVVGTYGYMPPEQFGERTVPASDLYSLGATLIYLVTGTHPADLPQQDLRIQFEQLANISPAFTDWLKWMTQPSLDRRLTSAQTALQVLNQSPQIETALLTEKKPTGSKISLTKDINSLEILVPSEGFRPATAFISLFAIAWLSGTYCWTVSALSASFFTINLFFALFSLPFWAAGCFMAYTALVLIFGRTRLRLNQQQVSLNRELFRFKPYALRSNIRHDINKLVYIPKHLVKEDGELFEVKSQLIIWAGAQKYELGGNDGLICNEPELEWLAHELSVWLGLPITRE